MPKLLIRSTYIEETGETIIERLNNPLWFWATFSFVSEAQEFSFGAGRQFSDWGYAICDVDPSTNLFMFAKRWFASIYKVYRRLCDTAWKMTYALFALKSLLASKGFCQSPDLQNWKHILFDWSSVDSAKARENNQLWDLSHAMKEWCNRHQTRVVRMGQRTVRVSTDGKVR